MCFGFYLCGNGTGAYGLKVYLCKCMHTFTLSLPSNRVKRKKKNRERERERERKRESKQKFNSEPLFIVIPKSLIWFFNITARLRARACACACAYERNVDVTIIARWKSSAKGRVDRGNKVAAETWCHQGTVDKMWW